MRFIYFISMQTIFFGCFLTPLLTNSDAFFHDKIFYIDYMKELYFNKDTMLHISFSLFLAMIGYTISCSGSFGQRIRRFFIDIFIAILAFGIMTLALYSATY